MILHDVKQGSLEWLELRRGKFTASNFGKLMSGKSTKGYNDLLNTIVFERIAGIVPEGFTNEWMERGKELEAEALDKYELKTFNAVDRIGFVEYDEWVGCSPDGLIEEDGMIQAKCPKYNTLIGYILANDFDEDYKLQMQGELWVTGRKWSDFWAYHPNFRPMLKRLERDEKVISDIQKRIEESIKEVEKRIKQITKG